MNLYFNNLYKKKMILLNLSLFRYFHHIIFDNILIFLILTKLLNWIFIEYNIYIEQLINMTTLHN